MSLFSQPAFSLEADELDTGPEALLNGLVAARTLPRAAIAACLENFDIIAPTLRSVLIRASEGEILSPADEDLLFWGLHILAARRDASAFKPLLRLLRRSDDEIDSLLGDTATATLARVTVSLFDNDAASLFDLLAVRNIDGFIRWSLFSALAFLTFDGRIDARLTEAFLIRFDTEALADEDDIGWVGWQEAVTLLGLRSLADRIERRSYNPVIAAVHGEGPKAFYEDLEAVEAAPHDIARFTKANVGYLDDIYETLDWVQPSSDDEGKKTASWDYSELKPETYVNPWRNVGRNDPFPCGSGKKAKKCCLASA